MASRPKAALEVSLKALSGQVRLQSHIRTFIRRTIRVTSSLDSKGSGFCNSYDDLGQREVRGGRLESGLLGLWGPVVFCI